MQAALRLDCRLVDHSLKIVNSSANNLEFSAVVTLKRLITSAFELFDLLLDGSFVETDDVVVLMHIDAQRIAERCNQLILVHDAVALQRLVLDTLGDLAKLGYGFALQFIVGVGHSF